MQKNEWKIGEHHWKWRYVHIWRWIIWLEICQFPGGNWHIASMEISWSRRFPALRNWFSSCRHVARCLSWRWSTSISYSTWETAMSHFIVQENHLEHGLEKKNNMTPPSSKCYVGNLHLEHPSYAFGVKCSKSWFVQPKMFRNLMWIHVI